MTHMNETLIRELKTLTRRYNSWCNWQAKFQVHWAAYLAEAPKNADGNVDWDALRRMPWFTCSVPYPKGRPSKNSKYDAYGACRILRDALNIEVAREDIGSVREWRAVMVACGVRNVKPLPKCNERGARD